MVSPKYRTSGNLAMFEQTLLPLSSPKLGENIRRYIPPCSHSGISKSLFAEKESSSIFWPPLIPGLSSTEVSW